MGKNTKSMMFPTLENLSMVMAGGPKWSIDPHLLEVIGLLNVVEPMEIERHTVGCFILRMCSFQMTQADDSRKDQALGLM